MRQHIDMRDKSESPEDTGRSILLLEDKTTETRQDVADRRAAAQQLPRKAALTVGAVPVRPSAATPPALPPSPPSAGQRSQEAGSFAAGGTHRRSALCTGLWCRVCCSACRARRQALGPLGRLGHLPLCKRPDRDGFPGAAQVVKDLFGPFVLLVKGHSGPSHPRPPSTGKKALARH